MRNTSKRKLNHDAVRTLAAHGLSRRKAKSLIRRINKLPEPVTIDISKGGHIIVKL